jgi:hypothetical protein
LLLPLYLGWHKQDYINRISWIHPFDNYVTTTLFSTLTTLNGKDFKGFFLMGYAQRNRTSFLNTCAKKYFGFWWIWSINMEISINTKTRLQVMTWSLVFVLKLISTFIGQNKEFFLCMCWRRMFCFSLHSPWEKNLKSFLLKMVLSWKQCSCDVINIERVYCHWLLPERDRLRDGPLEKWWGGWGKNRKKIHANKKDLKKNTCIRLV